MRELPTLGVGVSYRAVWGRDVLLHRERLDCLEIIAEHYVERTPRVERELSELSAAFPLVPHGIGLSFGTDAPLDADHLRKVARLFECLGPPWFTEHLSYTEAHGWDLGHLAPLPLTGEAVDAVCRNVKLWQDTVGVPLLLENITKMVVLPGELTEAQFTTEVIERSGCGLLLDLHNLHTNAVNHGFDPFELLEALPLERVGQIHLAGGREDEDGYRYDSHSAPPPEAVWELLRFVAARTSLNAVILEWDQDQPPIEVVLREVDKAGAILAGAGRGAA
jgi:uncharacterized protein (UPF0276 family)